MKTIPTTQNTRQIHEDAVKSIVQVYFPERHTSLAYFNDLFDLHVGDIVYVEGSLEGMRGRVENVSYNFKIKLSNYKRVIGKADVSIKGKFHITEDCFIAFSPDILPYEKILGLFKAPDKDEDVYVYGSDESSFLLEDLKGMEIRREVAERGRDYYLNDRVCYLCLDDSKGYAIVNGTKAYEVGFTYQEGKISNLTCDCYYSYTCKHEFAVMLKLKDILETLKKDYPEQQNGYWAAINKAAFFNTLIANKKSGTLTLE